MHSYIVDRMVVANSRFNTALSAASKGILGLIIVEEIMHESRGDSGIVKYRPYETNITTREQIGILKHKVVSGMIDANALLPNEGAGEVMIAVEYWNRGLGTQIGLFDTTSDLGKVVVTDDKRALSFFRENDIPTISSSGFFDMIEGGIES